MDNALKNIGIVILAAGKGKRMAASADQPKVLVPLLGRPLLAHLLSHIRGSRVATTPVVVIAPDLYVIREQIGPSVEYAIQESQLGTGHAVLAAKNKLFKYDHVLVLYGDHPLVSAATINTLVGAHLGRGAEMTLATLRLPNFDDWLSIFDGYGRIKRDEDARIAGIVERKDARKEEAALTEVNPGYYVFESRWLWSVLPKLNRNNAPQEYYLTDLVRVALAENRRVQDVPLLEPREAIGINTLEQLAIAESVMQEQLDASARLHTARLPL